ncbi:MAG: response regulator [Pseudomonadota bacterium]
MNSVTGTATTNASVVLFSDKPVLMRAVRDHLRERKFTNITVISDHERVLSTMRTQATDLLVVDMDVEDDWSMKVMKKIREDKYLFRVPIIALSGNASKDTVLKAARAGANDVMVKPFPLKQLHDRVVAALKSDH